MLYNYVCKIEILDQNKSINNIKIWTIQKMQHIKLVDIKL